MTETKAQPIQKNKSTQVRVEASTFKDRDLLQVREWYLVPPDEWRPTKRGITLPIEQADDLVSAIESVLTGLSAGDGDD